MRVNKSIVIFASFLGVCSANGVMAQVLPEGYCGIVYASEPSLKAVRVWITENPSYPPSAVYKSNNQFFAITGGIIPIEGWEERIGALVEAGRIPAQSFCSARGLVQAVSPVDFLPGAIQKVEEPSVAQGNPPIQKEKLTVQTGTSSAPNQESIGDPNMEKLDEEIEEAMQSCDDKLYDCNYFRKHLEADRERRKPILQLAQDRGEELARRCDDEASIQKLCWKLTPDEMEAVLTWDGFECKTYTMSKGVQCQKSDSGAHVRIEPSVVTFNCKALNVCGWSAREAAGAAIEAGLVDQMEQTDIRELTGMIGETVVETYCGRAENGQKLCLDASSRGDVDFSLHQGTMGQGGVQF